MTQEQKEILIAKMIDVPHSLSDEDLEAIMTDGELRDIYEISSTVRGSFIRQPEMDVAEEWKLFRQRIQPKPTKMRWAIRVAAIFSGILLVYGTVMKIADHYASPEEQLLNAKKEHTAHEGNILTITKSSSSTTPQENLTTKPTIRNNQASVSSQHHDQTKTKKQKEPEGTIIDIDEYLRIQQARIDNDLAVQVAEAYMEEYYLLLPMLDASGTNNPYIDNLIRKTTMQ